ncbi:MAG: ETC complex I subunit [Pseudomonadota bacterium]
MQRIARIYKPAKSAMTSGQKKTKYWVFEYEPGQKKRKDPVMGWAGSGDTLEQVRLTFATQAEAIAYAKREGLAYRIVPVHDRTLKPKSYADNFR